MRMPDELKSLVKSNPVYALVVCVIFFMFGGAGGVGGSFFTKQAHADHSLAASKTYTDQQVILVKAEFRDEFKDVKSQIMCRSSKTDKRMLAADLFNLKERELSSPDVDRRRRIEQLEDEVKHLNEILRGCK